MITRLILMTALAAFIISGCSSKKMEEIDYKTQQKNSQKAFDKL